MPMTEVSVLVVEEDADERRRIGAIFEAEGFDVVACPGPQEPDYTCLGGRGLPCPLTRDADVVVLDLRLASDEMLQGTTGWQLLLYYVESGKRIVALSGEEDSVHPLADDQVSVIKRPAGSESLLSAVRDLVRRSSAEGGIHRGEDPAR